MLSNLHSAARSIATASAQTQLCPSPSTGLDAALSNMLRAARSIAAARIPPALVDINDRAMLLLLPNTAPPPYQSRLQALMSDSVNLHRRSTLMLSNLHSAARSVATARAQTRLCPSPSTGPDTALPKTCSAPPDTPRLQQPTRWTTQSEYSWASPTQPSQGVSKTC